MKTVLGDYEFGRDIALVCIDIQNDFANPNGTLYVKGGEELVDELTFLVHFILGNDNTPEISMGNLVVWTKDWHPENHCSFKENGGIWPKHCVNWTWGAKLIEGLPADLQDIYIIKGDNENIDSYSAFFDNDHQTKTNLEEILNIKNIKKVMFCGIATDYCVKYSVLDALKLNKYEVSVYLPACRGVNLKEGDVLNSIKEMEEAGAIIIEE